MLTAAGSTRAWRRTRAYVLDRDGHRCQLPGPGGRCLELATHVDHVVPRAAGGSDDPSNLRAACASCNLRRGTGQPRPAPRRRPDRAGWSW